MYNTPFINNRMIADLLERLKKEMPKDYDVLREIEKRVFGYHR